MIRLPSKLSAPVLGTLLVKHFLYSRQCTVIQPQQDTETFILNYCTLVVRLGHLRTQIAYSLLVPKRGFRYSCVQIHIFLIENMGI